MSGQNWRVLVVEDEPMIALMIQDMLEELGCEVVGPVAQIEPALALADGEEIALALLDVNLDGEEVYPVADRLQQRGVPIIFLTGYGNAGVDARYRQCPVLTKPFPPAGLKGAVTALMQRAPPAG